MTCIAGDPACPCQDGDLCHYRAYGDSPAWPLPEPLCPSFTLPVNVRSALCSVCGQPREQHPQLPAGLAARAEQVEEQLDPDFRPARKR